MTNKNLFLDNEKSEFNPNIIILFLIYVVFVILFTVNIRIVDYDTSINIIPFTAEYELIHELIESARLYGIGNVPHELTFMTKGLLNLFGNIVMFIPFGCFMSVLLRDKQNNWWLTSSFGLFFSLLIELTQLITGCGCFDVDDIILNIFGSVIGFIIYQIWKN